MATPGSSPTASPLTATAPAPAAADTTTSAARAPQPLARPARRPSARALPINKNLRAISLALVAKVRARAVSTSTAIAEELAREAVAEVAAGGVSRAELAAVEKNIRRRLYDALKVLVSVGAITRVRASKTLRWNGVAHLRPTSNARPPPSSPSSTGARPPAAAADQQGPTAADAAALEQLRDSAAEQVSAARVRVGDKAATLRALSGQQEALNALCERNRARPQALGPDHSGLIPLPFVLVRTPDATNITLETTDDAQSVYFAFSDYFQVVNDAGIIDRLFRGAEGGLPGEIVPLPQVRSPRATRKVTGTGLLGAVSPVESVRRRKRQRDTRASKPNPQDSLSVEIDVRNGLRVDDGSLYIHHHQDIDKLNIEPDNTSYPIDNMSAAISHRVRNVQRKLFGDGSESSEQFLASKASSQRSPTTLRSQPQTHLTPTSSFTRGGISRRTLAPHPAPAISWSKLAKSPDRAGFLGAKYELELESRESSPLHLLDFYEHDRIDGANSIDFLDMDFSAPIEPL
jgi:Transcription factor DP/E2F/DP family winged-helix DNA-binding domain